MIKLKLLKIDGISMHPALESGAFVLVWRWEIGRYRQQVQVGDIVAIRHSYYGEIIKRVSQVRLDNNGQAIALRLCGDNAAASVTEVQMGWIMLEQVIGKVVYVVKGRR